MHTDKKENGIISLIVMFTIGFLALSMALAISISALSEFSKNRNTVLGDKAFYTAEAAARKGVYQFLNDTSYTGETLQPEMLLNNASEGSITVDPCPAVPYLCVKGSVSLENQIASRDAVYKLTIFPEGLAFNYAVFSQNNLNFKGSASVEGNVFANTGIDFIGNKASVNGDAFSPGTIDDVSNIKGEIVSGVDSVPPLEINADDYDIPGAQVFTTVSEAKNYLNEDRDGDVILIKDTNELKLGSINFLNGCIATKGSLELTGTGKFTAKDNFPALVVEGDLKITGDAYIEGVVYVKGNTLFQGGNVEIHGALISEGTVNDTQLVGDVNITFDLEKIGDWLEFPGIDPGSSTSPPRIINWWEE